MENNFDKAFYFIMASEYVTPDIVYFMLPKIKITMKLKTF